jgi:hypothetical protein
MLTYYVITIQIKKELKKGKVMVLSCEKQFDTIKIKQGWSII